MKADRAQRNKPLPPPRPAPWTDRHKKGLIAGFIGTAALITGYGTYKATNENNQTVETKASSTDSAQLSYSEQVFNFLDKIEAQDFKVPGSPEFFPILKGAIKLGKINFKVGEIKDHELGYYDPLSNTLHHHGRLTAEERPIILHELVHAYYDAIKSSCAKQTCLEGEAYLVQLRYVLFKEGYRSIEQVDPKKLAADLTHNDPADLSFFEDQAMLTKGIGYALTNDPAVWQTGITSRGQEYRRMSSISGFCGKLEGYFQNFAADPGQARDIRWTFKGKFPTTIPAPDALAAARLWHLVLTARGEERNRQRSAFLQHMNNNILPLVAAASAQADNLNDYPLNGL